MVGNDRRDVLVGNTESMKHGNGPSQQVGQGKKLKRDSAIALVDACAPRKQKRNPNNLDEADFVRDGDKRIYRQLSRIVIRLGRQP